MLGRGNSWIWYLLPAFCVLLFYLFFKRIRTKFPVLVNCWFCNKNTTVSAGLRNSWHCPSCEQYNGFNQDGDYNKIIEEQHVEHLNKRSPVLKPTGYTFQDSNRSNGFCNLCNLNQQLKIQQLALFIPTKEENFDVEIKKYREQLEKSYHLCSSCEETLNDTLEKQKTNLFGSRPEIKQSEYSKGHNFLDSSKLQKFGSIGSKFISVLVALWIACALIINRAVELEIFDSLLPGFLVLDSLPEELYLQKLQIIFSQTHQFCKELTGIGFLSYFLSTCSHRSDAEVINLMLWGFFHASTWTSFTCLQLFFSVALLLFVFDSSLNRRYYLSDKPLKKILKNASVLERPIKKESSEWVKEGKSKIKSVLEPFSIGSKIESCYSDSVPKHLESASGESLPSLFEKSTLNKMNLNFPGENLTEASDEIYSDMTHLSLGAKVEKNEKPVNFLFQNHNFKRKSKDVYPLLKPPKLFHRSANSLLYPNLEESLSDNAIPSVCSGTKPEKLESKDCYDFSRAGYPVSTTPFHQMNFLNSFNCFEGNPSHFCNDFNCQEHNFIPFSNNFNHVPTGVCSYPLRDNFPYSYKFLPDCQYFSNKWDRSAELTNRNFDQNASQRNRFHIYWNNGKSFFYAASFVLNVFSLIFFSYYLWSGFILFELRLPSFNFYV